MAKILFLMDDTTHIDKTELLNKKYNTNGISDFLNKEFERQKQRITAGRSYRC